MDLTLLFSFYSECFRLRDCQGEIGQEWSRCEVIINTII